MLHLVNHDSYIRAVLNKELMKPVSWLVGSSVCQMTVCLVLGREDSLVSKADWLVHYSVIEGVRGRLTSG